MKDYMEVVKQKGLYNALLELETDAIMQFVGLNRAEIARRLKLGRTTLGWKIKKNDLGRFFKASNEEK